MYQPIWHCDVLGPVVLVVVIYEGRASCECVGLECVGYLVCNFVMSSYAKASSVQVGACGE